MSSETPKHGGSGGGELEKRVAGVETRLTVIEKTMVTTEVFQREIAAFRDELRLAIGGLQAQIGRQREDMLLGFSELRTQMQAEYGAVRTEMQAQEGALRNEIGGLRGDMRVGFGELRKEMQAMDGALRVEIGRTPFETFKWLLAAAGLAAAIATAIYNIWFR